MKLQLPNVTLVMIETREHELARLAVDDCCRFADFGEVLIFSDKFLPFETCAFSRVHKVDDWPTKEGWSQFLWNEVGASVHTPHLLSIQWDSWIVNPTAWTDEFLRYDYIGAPWWYTDGRNVGNGGFSLRSTALQRYIAKHRDKFPCINAVDDDLLCRQYRPALQARGFEWAPQPLAERFAFECQPPVPVRTQKPVPVAADRGDSSDHAVYETGLPFGFHGIFNWPKVLDADRLRERVEIAKRSKYITGNAHMWGQLRKAYPEIDASS